MTKPKFLVPSAVTAFAVLAIVVFSLATSLKPVSAAELTQQSLAKVSKLSPDQEQALEMRVNGDPKAELQAAKDAKDLQILTYDQFRKLQPQADTVSIHGPNDGSPGPDSLNSTSLKYLKYTSADGATHIIGVGKDGLPVLIMMFKQNSDGSSMGSVQVTGNDGSGHMSTGSISGQASATAMPAGMVRCSANESGQPVCTNSDGSAAPAPNCQSLGDGKMTCSSSATVQTTQP